jgi:hypothetical protein
LEKGEIAILAIQFGALLVVVLVVGNILPVGSVQTTPTVTGVYWGDPASSQPVQNGGTLKTHANQSIIYVYFQLNGGGEIASTSASRFCINQTKGEGESTTYVRIQFGYDTGRKANYLLITPTTQRIGLSCVYNVQITDRLLQTVKWTATIIIVP